MVQKYYVITVGADPGVHFKDWIEVAPLVKNYPSSIYSKAESEEEAWRLFENARLNGQVRDLSRPPGPTASPRPQTTSPRRSSTGSASSTQRPNRTSASKLTVSRSEGQVGNSVSPARSSFREPNIVIAPGRTTTSVNRVIAVAKSHSEPVSASSKKVYVQRCSASDGTGAFSSVGNANTPVRTRVEESPSWLASYPGDEIEQSSSSALSPIASPVTSPRSFESCRLVPFSTPSTSRRNGEAVEHIGYDVSEPVKSPVPSFRRQEVRGSSSFGVNQATESGNAALPENSHHVGAGLQLQGDIGPFVQLVVDEVLKRLHPSNRVKDELLTDSISEHTSRPDSRNNNTQSERRSKRNGVLSPGSHSLRNTLSPSPRAKGLPSPSVPKGSLLFDRGCDSLGPIVRNGHPKRNGLCSHCKGTGYDAGDNTVLDEAGLSQPNLTPFHPYDAIPDPRSPFTGLKRLASPFAFQRPSPIVSPSFSAKTSF